MQKHWLILLLLIVSANLKAQYFQTGQDPANIKWRQINSPDFQIIYPDYYERQAQKLAYILETVYSYKNNSNNHKPKKISVILHTQTVKSNGLVAIAPKRSEFYTTPNQGIYPQNWLEQLAIHEFRHMVQIDEMEEEIPKLIRIIFGEQGVAAVLGLYIPWWFIEGDAVVTETALSRFGRGRMPDFLMEHRAQVVEKGIYKYDKAYNGSYIDFVPDHYKLGYYLVGETRKRYGAGVWNPVFKRAGQKPLSVVPFDKGLKNETGFKKVRLYNSVFDSLKNVWTEENNKYWQCRFETVSQPQKVFTNYRYNHIVNDSLAVSYKTSLRTVPEFVTIDKNGKEKRLFKPGEIFKESVNYRDEQIVYAERIPDIRWQHSGKTVIKVYNILTSVKTNFKPEFKAFAPSLSPDKSRVLLVESDFSSNNYLSVYDIKSGHLLHRIGTENNCFLFSPDWINNNEVVAIVLLKEGKRIAKFNLETGDMKLLTDTDLGDIKQLRFADQKLYFVSSYTGKSSIFYIDLNDNSVYCIYEPRFGAGYFDFGDNRSMIFSDYTAGGYRILKVNKDDLVPVPLSKIKMFKYNLADVLATQENGVISFGKTDTVKYNSKKYRKIPHLFNFHSWGPVSINPDSYSFKPGVSFMSQNLLGTAETILGYEFDTSEKTGKVYADFSYKGWYPVFDLKFSYGNRSSVYRIISQKVIGNNSTNDTTSVRFTWNEINFDLNSRIPFNFSSGKYYRLLEPEIGYNYTLYSHNNSTPEKFYNGNSQTLSYRLYYQQLLKRSMQDLFPDFGFIIDAAYYHTPLGGADMGSMFLGQSVLYLPGILANHGIRLYAGYQNKNYTGDYYFSDAIRYPRGWAKVNSNQMESYAIDYKLPLFYPEWNVWSLVYLKRVNTSLFADYGIIDHNIYQNGEIAGTTISRISSYGFELTGDMNLLRFYAPVNMGFRTSYLPEVNDFRFDFLFSINFNAL